MRKLILMLIFGAILLVPNIHTSSAVELTFLSQPDANNTITEGDNFKLIWKISEVDSNYSVSMSQSDNASRVISSGEVVDYTITIFLNNLIADTYTFKLVVFGGDTSISSEVTVVVNEGPGEPTINDTPFPALFFLPFTLVILRKYKK